MKSILDPSFRYTNSVDTDLRETFARVRRELERQRRESPMAGIEVISNVLSFRSHTAESEEQGVRSKRLVATGGILNDS